MKDTQTHYPRSVAIIMDGNGRWAKNQGHERVEGHKSGVGALKKVVRYTAQTPVEYLTVYAFSSENWNRPKAEVEALMQLFVFSLSSEIEELTAQGVKLHFLGDTTALPEALQSLIAETQDCVPEKITLNLVVAMNYGSREEIAGAARKIAQKVENGELTAEDISPQTLSEHMQLPEVPDPDLMIRTSGELRLSNFMLWQLSYSELYFTDVAWPDFDHKQMELALEHYASRHRRYGAL